MTVDPDLRARIERGEYDVDARLIAAAMIEKLAGPSGVLEPVDLERAAIHALDGEPGAGTDAA